MRRLVRPFSFYRVISTRNPLQRLPSSSSLFSFFFGEIYFFFFVSVSLFRTFIAGTSRTGPGRTGFTDWTAFTPLFTGFYRVFLSDAAFLRDFTVVLLVSRRFTGFYLVL